MLCRIPSHHSVINPQPSLTAEPEIPEGTFVLRQVGPGGYRTVGAG